MAPAPQSMVAATYVRDIAVSRAFYGLLGFQEIHTGSAPTASWSYLQGGGHYILLGFTRPRLDIAPIPLLFYFFYADVEAVVTALAGAGVPFRRGGRPAHAPGGEIRLTDPDGNTVLIGQREPAATTAPEAEGQESPHFSLLAEAAAAVSARGGANTACQITGLPDTPCAAPANVKLADSAGHSAWACLRHADVLMITVPSVFIASETDQGLARYSSGG